MRGRECVRAPDSARERFLGSPFLGDNVSKEVFRWSLPKLDTSAKESKHPTYLPHYLLVLLLLLLSLLALVLQLVSEEVQSLVGNRL
jgi:hypothetical protein